MSKNTVDNEFHFGDSDTMEPDLSQLDKDKQNMKYLADCFSFELHNSGDVEIEKYEVIDNGLKDTKLSNDKSVFFRDELIENLTLPKIINSLGNPDYERKEGKILTFQYRQNECVVDFFFKDNSDKLIFYDMRKKDYLEKFSKKLCILSLNLRRLYK